jgi:DNA-binding Xre family transcriptional regulator
MVRIPLTADQIESGRRLGVLLRQARAGREPAAIAQAAGISPETLRKIEVGRMPSPGFGTVLALCEALDLPIERAASVWTGESADRLAG